VIGPDLDLYSFRALWRHYRQCRRNKRNTINALAFEVNAEANLLALQEELRAHTYKPGRSICFITDGPKPREVFAADFRDRVVHHLLVSHQERVFEPIFIHDSYACRKDKGTLAASDRLMTFLRRVTTNGKRAAWALKLDVASFFPSIDKAVLCAILTRKIKHPELVWLTRTLLFHDPTTNYRFQSRRSYVGGPKDPNYPIPAHKSLFGKNNEQGLPIGNLTSQFWGNVYMNELDQFIKRELKCHYYLRYVDDMVLLATNGDVLAEWCEAIQQFLREQLKLSLRPEMLTPVLVRRGIEFVGWKTWWNHRLPRRRTVGNLKTKLDRFERAAVRTVLGGLAQRIDLRRQDEDGSAGKLYSMLASYAGHLKHGAALRAWERIWAKRAWLGALLEQRGWSFAERWSRRGMNRARSFRSQYWPLACHAGNDSLVFCQVGRFVEFYGPQRLLAARALGLRSVALPRAGYAFTAGFPTRLSGLYVAEAIRRGMIVVEVRQISVPLRYGCAPRLPCAVSMPILEQRPDSQTPKFSSPAMPRPLSEGQRILARRRPMTV
jgi:RNA-directed DNA polymerase